MESHGLARVWKNKMINLGWSEESSSRIVLHWASSTLQTYDRYIKHFVQFCDTKEITFPPRHSAVIADFMCYTANSSGRPRAALTNSLSALIGYYDALSDGYNPARDKSITMLCDGLIKSGTKAPRVKTPVMPVKPFHDLFKSWPDNALLDLRRLRLKTITLLALVAMLRPSDIAPHARIYMPESGLTDSMTLSVNQIRFELDNSVTIWFHGIKNDYKRDGFEVRIAPSEDPQLDPVGALKCYIEKTETMRPSNGSVFLTLVRPFRGISSTTVGKILGESISLAGLEGQQFSAKSFRPTGATASVQAGCNPDIIRHVGRWKSRDVFEQHYVHPEATQAFTDVILMS